MAKKGRQPSLIALLVAVTLAACGFASSGCGGSSSPPTPDGMTLEVKIGQLFMIGFDGTHMTPELEDLLRTVHPGGVILFGRNVQDAQQVAALTHAMQEVALDDTGQPLLVAIDQEGGQVRRLPWLDDTTAQADIRSADQAYALGRLRGEALASLGINLNLAPVLDVAGPGDFLYRSGRILPGTAENIGVLGSNIVSGQTAGGIFSCVKHFPGYVGIDYDPETVAIPMMAAPPDSTAFVIATGAQPAMVMTANVIYNSLDPDLPFSLSSAGIAYLRNTLAGDYLVITDDLASKVLQERYTLPETTVLACRAGADILLVSLNLSAQVEATYRRLVEAVRNGEVSEAAVGRTVARILNLKAQLTQP